jgi:hypothetical protein
MVRVHDDSLDIDPSITENKIVEQDESDDEMAYAGVLRTESMTFNPPDSGLKRHKPKRHPSVKNRLVEKA